MNALDGRAHLPAQPCALSGGDLTDVVRPFDEQDVGLSGLRQAVGNAAPHGSAADNDDLRLLNAHLSSLANCFKYHCTKPPLPGTESPRLRGASRQSSSRTR